MTYDYAITDYTRAVRLVLVGWHVVSCSHRPSSVVPWWYVLRRPAEARC
jgi:hypothetical protein